MAIILLYFYSILCLTLFDSIIVDTLSDRIYYIFLPLFNWHKMNVVSLSSCYFIAYRFAFANIILSIMFSSRSRMRLTVSGISIDMS